MSRIEELIAELCPNGASYRRVAESAVVVPTARGVQRKDYRLGSAIPIVDQGQSLIAGYTDDTSIALPVDQYVIFGDHTREVKWVDFAFTPGADGTKVLQPAEGVSARYLFHTLLALDVPSRGYNRHWTVLRDMRIPVPPVEVQREIVRVLDLFTRLEAELEAELAAELAARHAQYAHYRDSLLRFGEDQVRWVTLPEVSTNRDGQRRPVTKSARTAGDIPYYGASGVVDHVDGFIFEGDFLLVSEDGANLLARSTPIAFSVSGKTWVNNHAHVLEFRTYAERRFAEIYLNSIDLSPFVTGGAQPKLSQANLNRIALPSPPFVEQERIVGILDQYDALVNDLSIGLPAELHARRKQYEHYRDRLLTFKELVA